MFIVFGPQPEVALKLFLKFVQFDSRCSYKVVPFPKACTAHKLSPVHTRNFVATNDLPLYTMRMSKLHFGNVVVTDDLQVHTIKINELFLTNCRSNISSALSWILFAVFWGFERKVNHNRNKRQKLWRMAPFNLNRYELILFRLDFLRVAQLGGAKGGGGKCPRPVTIKLLMIIKWNLVE